jgi:hypothetical protein
MPAKKKKPAAKPANKKPARKPAKKPPAKKPAKKPAPRKDFGKPVAAFFAAAPAATKPMLDAFRTLVEEAAPDATSSLKWGMPFYEIGGNMVAAIGGHKAHVNLILPGSPSAYADPNHLLEGEGKTGRHLRVSSASAIPTAQVRAWLKTAVARAR